MGGQLVLGVVLALLGAAVALSLTLPLWQRGLRRRQAAARARRRAAADAAPRSTPALPSLPRRPGWQDHRLLRHWSLRQQIRRAQQRRSLQRVSADLRRLRGLLVEDHNDSAVHQFAHRLAYDQLLVEACEMLAVPHGLGPEVVRGPEREIERFRAEANLQAAGVVLIPRIRHVLD